MGSEVLVAYLAHPLAIAVAIAIVAALSAAQYPHDRSPISPSRLVVGYLAALLVCIAITAVSSYVPQTEAATKWQVPAERYWQVQANTFLTELVLVAYLAVFGIATIGLAIIFALGRRNLATVPWVLLSSAVISVLTAALLSATNQPPFRQFVYTATYMLGMHLLLSLGFCLGAGLPWKRRAST